jgi:hypothetical protein
MDDRVARIVDAFRGRITAEPLADGRRYRILAGPVIAYVYARRGYLRGVARKEAVEAVAFGDWDRELATEFWGHPGVEIRVTDRNIEQEARLLEMIRRLAASVRG